MTSLYHEDYRDNEETLFLAKQFYHPRDGASKKAVRLCTSVSAWVDAPVSLHIAINKES